MSIMNVLIHKWGQHFWWPLQDTFLEADFLGKRASTYFKALEVHRPIVFQKVSSVPDLDIAFYLTASFLDHFRIFVNLIGEVMSPGYFHLHFVVRQNDSIICWFVICISSWEICWSFTPVSILGLNVFLINLCKFFV